MKRDLKLYGHTDGMDFPMHGFGVTMENWQENQAASFLMNFLLQLLLIDDENLFLS